MICRITKHLNFILHILISVSASRIKAIGSNVRMWYIYKKRNTRRGSRFSRSSAMVRYKTEEFWDSLA